MLRYLLPRLLRSRAELVAGAAIALIVGASALRVSAADPALPSPVPPSGGQARSSLPAVPPHPPAEALVQARLADPFRPDRSPPPGRYGLETQPEAEAAYAAPGRAVAMEMQLRGTAVAGGVRLALIENPADGRGLRIYRDGDSISSFIVRLVSGDSVVLVGDDTTVVLAIERPWKP